MPTQTIILDKDILNDNDYIQLIIAQIEEFEGNIRLFLSSDGGDPFLGIALVNVLNQPDNINRVELIANNYVGSSAFEIFYKFKGNRSIVFGTNGMFHHVSFGGFTATGDFKHKSNHNLYAAQQKARTLAKETERMAKEFCTKKELKMIANGDNCYFPYERMLEIFKGINIIND